MKTGVYRGAGASGVAHLPEYVRWIGDRPSRILDFFDQGAWDRFDSSSVWAAQSWRNAAAQLDPATRFTFSVPMLVADGQSTIAQGNAGAYDAHFTRLAQTLVANGFASCDLRIGWEMNLGNYPWAAAKDPTGWKVYFQRIVKLLRAVPGTDFRIVWNIAAGWNQIRAEQLWPGDEFADLVGVDVYNQSWRPENDTPQKRWSNEFLGSTWDGGSYGLAWGKRFAADHGKALAIPEFGTGLRADGHGLGDDPYFMSRMVEFIAAQKIDLWHLWDYPAKDINCEVSSGQYPAAGAAYNRALCGVYT
jgi:hypothetical protein